MDGVSPAGVARLVEDTPRAKPLDRIAEVVERLRPSPIRDASAFHVTDADDRPVGVVGLVDLQLADRNARVADCVEHDLPTICVDEDQERVTHTAIRLLRRDG